jgi:hypothetical protein
MAALRRVTGTVHTTPQKSRTAIVHIEKYRHGLWYVHCEIGLVL